MCVTYIKTVEVMEWQEIGRTEIVNNTLNPNFMKKVRYGWNVTEFHYSVTF
jgi:hypothetical protein